SHQCKSPNWEFGFVSISATLKGSSRHDGEADMSLEKRPAEGEFGGQEEVSDAASSHARAAHSTRRATKKRANPETIRRLKLGDLKRLLQRRYKGRCLPEGDDAALDDLELLLTLVSLGRQSKSQTVTERMLFGVEEVAPWMSKADADQMIDCI